MAASDIDEPTSEAHAYVAVRSKVFIKVLGLPSCVGLLSLLPQLMREQLLSHRLPVVVYHLLRHDRFVVSVAEWQASRSRSADQAGHTVDRGAPSPQRLWRSTINEPPAEVRTLDHFRL